MKFVLAANQKKNKTAIVSKNNRYSYQTLFDESVSFAAHLLISGEDLCQERVAFMVDPGFEYVKVQWGIWLAGGVAVPLYLSHPLPSLQYVIEDTAASVVVVSPNYKSLLEPLSKELGIRLIDLNELSESAHVSLPDVSDSRDAMILYTSGTTNKPKGVVTTHANINAQINSLLTAWEWNSADHILCVLPLHHVHGIINVVCCSLAAGATCEFIDEFSPESIFSLFQQGQINLFMAVPTIYYKLINYWEGLSADMQAKLSDSMKAFRLMVSGSAALPVSIMHKWEKISGHVLLERYGMTEIGMAISNPYRGERKAGFVGLPLPGVQIKLADDLYNEVTNNQPGEIIVKGPTVFSRYWQRPEATAESFTENGWFKTGDIAETEGGYYRILGRSSVDIIKSGGYKISALEIEEALRSYDDINDCAVVGIDDDEWGELIVACLVLEKQLSDNSFDIEALDSWIKGKIAPYKRPRRYLVVEELPRNAMGKVVKNEVKKLF